MQYSYVVISAAVAITLIMLYRIIFKWDWLKNSFHRGGRDKIFQWMISHLGDTALRICMGIISVAALICFILGLIGRS